MGTIAVRNRSVGSCRVVHTASGAEIAPGRLGPDQAEPASPDEHWPEASPGSTPPKR